MLQEILSADDRDFRFLSGLSLSKNPLKWGYVLSYKIFRKILLVRKTNGKVFIIGGPIVGFEEVVPNT
jgi:hypothetical protein